jgi:hypothetical protein
MSGLADFRLAATAVVAGHKLWLLCGAFLLQQIQRLCLILVKRAVI